MLPAVNIDGNRIHAAAQAGMRFPLDLRNVKVVHARSPGETAASTLAPPLTRSPTLTRNSAFAGNKTSTLEPNLMRPTRCPRSTRLAFDATADDAPRQQPRDLLEGDFEARVRALAAQRDGALLVALGRGGVHGIEVLALLIVDAADRAADGSTVDVHIEDAEEDADALPSAFRGGDGCSFGDQAVARRNNQAFAGGDGALGIAEKPEEKCRQENRGECPRPKRLLAT